MSDTISSNLYNGLQRLNRQIHRSKHRVIPPIEGINRGQIKLLFIISQNDGIIQRDLAEIMDIRPSSLTEMLISLEENLLITRKNNEKDRRVMHVYITTDGNDVIDGFNQANDNLSALLFTCLSLEEKEKMLEMVNKINTNLELMDSVSSVQCNEKKKHKHNCYKNKKHHRYCIEEE